MDKFFAAVDEIWAAIPWADEVFSPTEVAEYAADMAAGHLTADDVEAEAVKRAVAATVTN